ncbi:MAG: VOC family protein [gamma proteobacterium endosymbiont of Lamellibrachia anaximandri]|nr:VOC family protein [gamma proteobacterium endosymbiont of Lamellibrachia anaximandri]MBL3617805.1 VOC family protein [gamma proteobacterium endosymbiont of Lamellibrachia anaximandri]
MTLQIDHICLAVKSIDKAAQRICNFLEYKISSAKVLNTKQDVNVQFLSKENSLDIKLIEPGSSSSPLINFLKKGEGLHHIGMLGDNVNETTEELKSKGGMVTLPPEKGEAFCNELISFLYLGSGLNIELIDTNKRIPIKRTANTPEI